MPTGGGPPRFIPPRIPRLPRPPPPGAPVVVNENMRNRIAPSHSADDQVAPPAIASRRGNRLLVPWVAGLTVAVLWILVRTLA